MPYDICEDEAALDFIEGEMAKRGVTQQLIDDTRAFTEKQMLEDVKKIAANKGDLEAYDSQGATPVCISLCKGAIRLQAFSCCKEVFRKFLPSFIQEKAAFKNPIRLVVIEKPWVWTPNSCLALFKLCPV